MKLHVLPPSPNSIGCIAVVKDLGLSTEVVNAFGKTRTDEFLAMNPCHCCPTVELDDGTAIWESNTVLRTLCDGAENGDKLYPKDLKKRARINMALDWRQCNLYPCFVPIGYIAFGFEQDTEVAKQKFKALIEEHFPILMDIYLKDTPFIFSETPTIADLSVAIPLVLLKARPKFWEATPEKVKDYHKRVVDAFPGIAENYGMIEGMCLGTKDETDP